MERVGRISFSEEIESAASSGNFFEKVTPGPNSTTLLIVFKKV
jgi:hypothetical protein